MFLLIDCKDYMVAHKEYMVRSQSAEHWALDETKAKLLSPPPSLQQSLMKKVFTVFYEP